LADKTICQEVVIRQEVATPPALKGAYIKKPLLH